MLKHILPLSQRQEPLEKGGGGSQVKAMFTNAAIGHKRKTKWGEKNWEKRERVNKQASVTQSKSYSGTERTTLH